MTTDNPEYFLMTSSSDGLRAKLGRPPLPPPSGARASSNAASEARIVAKGINIAGRVSKFEKFVEASAHRSASTESLQNQLWFYKDGLRSRSASGSPRDPQLTNEPMARSRSANSSTWAPSGVALVRVSSTDIPSPDSPVLIQRRFNRSPSPDVSRKQDCPPARPPRKPSPAGGVSKPARPIPPPRTKSPAQRKESRLSLVKGASSEKQPEPGSRPAETCVLARDAGSQPEIAPENIDSCVNQTTPRSSRAVGRDGGKPATKSSGQNISELRKKFFESPNPTPEPSTSESIHESDVHVDTRKGRLGLEELLDFCADYERQIDAEQRVLSLGLDEPPSPSVFRSSVRLQVMQAHQPRPRSPVSSACVPHGTREISAERQRTSWNKNINNNSQTVTVNEAHMNGSEPVLDTQLSHVIFPHSRNTSNTAATATTTTAPPSISPATPNRIKTNGSLPRERMMSSPGPRGAGPAPPTSPFLTAPESELQRVFNFDGPGELNGNGFSLPRHMNGTHPAMPPYTNLPPMGGSSYLTMPQSPRSRIKTFFYNGSGQTTPSGSSSAETVREVSNDYQGGGEDLFATSKTKEQLYVEAKDILSMISGGSAIQASTRGGMPDYTNLVGGISPGSTAPRRPPKSKHDRDPNSPALEGASDQMFTLPSQEATNRLLIGTTMLNGNRRSPARAFSPEREIIQNTLATLKVEKESQIVLVSSLKKRLTNLEMKEEDDIRELEMERSLLIAEWEQESHGLNKIKASLSELTHLDGKLGRTLEVWRHECENEVEECRLKILAAQEELTRLRKLNEAQGHVSSEYDMDIVEQIKRQREVLHIEKKIFEDKEFDFMEKDSKREEEKENLSKEIGDLTSAMRKHEKQLQNIEEQQRKILMTVRRETRTLEGHRQSLIKQLEMERTKLACIDGKISQINAHIQQKPPLPPQKFFGSSQSRDFSKIPNIDSDHSDSDEANEVNDLRKSLSRLAMLDKSLEADLHRISVFDDEHEHLHHRNGYGLRPGSKSSNSLVGSQNHPSAVKTNGKPHSKAAKSLNSIGGSQDSVTGSFSDIHTESLSSDEYSGNKTSPSPNSERTDSSSSTTRHFSQNHRTKSTASTNSSPSTTTPMGVEHHQLMIMPRSGNPDFSEMSSTTNGSRPLSEVSSFWDGSDVPIEVKRRHNKTTVQRPLTRYLPIRNDDFDLRQHIETAGHQIELCSHLILNASSCRGYLHKLGAKFRTWNKRWFVFDRHKRTLIYYSDKTENKPKGGIYFQAIEDVYIDHQNQVKSPNSKVTFCMKTTERPYYLMAPSPEAMRIWVDVIFTGAEGYQEFMNQ